MFFSRDDYIGWRKNPITVEFMNEMSRELDNTIADLVSTAGKDQLNDTYKRGFIYGMQWLVDWEPKLIEEQLDDGTSSEGSQDSD